jgi:ferredoxin, 2Fe-2S
MGGVNPYIDKPDFEKPKNKFKVTILAEEGGKRKELMTIEVDPEKIPYGRTGLDGSVLDIAFGAGVEIDHACGGVCACATCHVYVEKGLESCSEATDDELDQLDTAPSLTTESRLSCQCVPNGTQDLVVVIPGWNKNYVKEG